MFVSFESVEICLLVGFVDECVDFTDFVGGDLVVQLLGSQGFWQQQVVGGGRLGQQEI